MEPIQALKMLYDATRLMCGPGHAADFHDSMKTAAMILDQFITKKVKEQTPKEPDKET